MFVFTSMTSKLRPQTGQVISKVFEKYFKKRKPRIAVNKVKFALFSIDYVGLYLTKDGIKPQEVHANTIIQFTVAQDVKTLKSFLALCNYCAGLLRLKLNRIPSKD